LKWRREGRMIGREDVGRRAGGEEGGRWKGSEGRRE
jgi:hypothetical protein